MDTAYRVSFFNNLTNCYGKPFKVCQRSIVIRSARSPARAIEAAKVRFARLEHICDWALHAEKIEVDVLPAEVARVSPARASNRKARNRGHESSPAV